MVVRFIGHRWPWERPNSARRHPERQRTYALHLENDVKRRPAILSCSPTWLIGRRTPCTSDSVTGRSLIAMSCSSSFRRSPSIDELSGQSMPLGYGLARRVDASTRSTHRVCYRGAMRGCGGWTEFRTSTRSTSTTVAFMVGVLGFCSGIGGRGVGAVVAMLTGAGCGQGWGAGSRSGG